MTKDNWYKLVLSGLMLGLSFPTYPAIRLEFLAWGALVPLLMCLKRKDSFRQFFVAVYTSLFVWTVTSVWWVSTSTLFFGWSSAITGILLYFAQAAFSFIPFGIFFLLRKYGSFQLALWTLPFFWTTWEWIYMKLEIAFPWITLGNSQSNLIWLVQYVDITGVYGVSFWIVLFNVILFVIFDAKDYRLALKTYSIPLVLMIALPLFYAWISFSENDLKSKSIKVSVVQPNFNPYEKWNVESDRLLSYYETLLDSAEANKTMDLVILPETALSYFLSSPSKKKNLDSLHSISSSRKAAIILGFADLIYYQEGIAPTGSRYDKYRKKRYDYFNSSMLISSLHDTLQIYHKVKLVPFGERVPYMDLFPFLSTFTIEIAGISSWGKGQYQENFTFLSRKGEPVILPGLICYESIFPEFVAEFVEKGANMISIITNDGWFLKTYGPYQHAAFSRLRAIENRRALARCANTGISFFIDKFGRVHGEFPWWTKGVTTQDVLLHEELTFFTQYPHLFSIVSFFVGCSLVLLYAMSPLIRRLFQ